LQELVHFHEKNEEDLAADGNGKALFVSEKKASGNRSRPCILQHQSNIDIKFSEHAGIEYRINAD